MAEICLYPAPFGDITLTFEKNELVALDLHKKPSENYEPLPDIWQSKLDRYFLGTLRDFNQPISRQGTDFQKKVWNIIAHIPFGSTMSYQDIAYELHSSPRAVGNACGKNPLALVIPCHRVVSKKGLGGFSSGQDKALQIKRWLLCHEGISI